VSDWDDPGSGGAGTHAALPDVTPDQHHAQAHALGGPDHAGAITDAQHGARGPIVGAHGHDDLDTVTADQHHAEAHAIDGAAHTGVLVDAQIPAAIARDAEVTAAVAAHAAIEQAHDLEHADLNLIGVDDHHARDHSIIGATHTAFPGGTTTFLRADATFAAPTAAAADPVYSPGSFTVATESGRYIPARMKLTGAQRATIAGTGRLVVSN